MKYTFVCCHGQHRGPAAARVMQDMLAEQGRKNRTIAHAGIELIVSESEFDRLYQKMFREAEPSAMSDEIEVGFFARRQEITEMKKAIEEADRVFVMEHWMGGEVRKKTRYKGKIISLDIPNKYHDQNDPELQQLLRTKLSCYID